MYDTTQDSGHTLHAGHIEAPRRPFFVQWDAESYHNVLHFAPGKRWARVLAETAEGAVKIATYHHGSRGKNFERILVPPVKFSKVQAQSISSVSKFLAGDPPVKITFDSPPCNHFARTGSTRWDLSSSDFS